MSEREIYFSQYEKEQIGLIARQTANLGEDVVFELVFVRLEFYKLALGWQNNPELQDLFPKPELMLHELDVMGEVIRQSKALMQFYGTDSLSILDRDAQTAGAGSIFDPSSGIGKHLSDFWDGSSQIKP